MHTKRVLQSRISRKLLALFMPVALVLGAFGAPSVAGAVRTALINDSTVSGGASSLEALAAVAAGFTVNVVSDATWAGMTQAQFGTYDLLIVGDPTCGVLPPGLVASAPVWGPVVLGTAGGRTQAGNRIIIGTDPVFHQSQGGSTLVSEGIAFAGVQPGRTNMYLDVTCAANYSGQSVETLALVNAISSPLAAGIWTIDATPPCGGSVSLIASVAGSFPTLTTATLQGWGCSVHESFPTFKTDFSAFAIATDTSTHPTCGVDPHTGLSACGEAYILISGSGIVVVSGSISVTPLTATNPVGTDHTVTAHVSDINGPLVGQVVTFTVTGVNAGAIGTCVPAGCVTDGSGDVSFTYHDTNGAGSDTIKASFIDAAGSLQSATASKDWTGPGPATKLTLDPKTATNTAGVQHCVTATVVDANGNPTPGVVVNFTVAGPNGPLTGTGTTDANGVATFCYTGTHAGTDTISAYADTNGDGIQQANEPSDTATKTYTPDKPATLTLSPKTATNVVDAQHCVTATVVDQFGNPVPGTTVTFTVAGSVSTTGTGTTDANGQATFCYTGPGLPGADVITATASGGTNPTDTAAKTWTIPPNNTACKITYGGRITAANGDKATFGGNAKGRGPSGGPSGQEEYQDHGTAADLNVHSINVLAVTCTADGINASIFGKATINGAGSFDYRIDVKDLGEPGSSDHYRIRLSNGYDSGDQVLSGGNIQTH